MSFDDDADEDAPLRPPPHPDDRIWRHPSEVASQGSRPGGVHLVRRSRLRSTARPPRIFVAAGVVLSMAASGLALAVLARGAEDPGAEAPASTTSTASAADAALADAASGTVAPAVVAVGRSDDDPTADDPAPAGSGVVVRPDGLLLTSASLMTELGDEGGPTVDVWAAGGPTVKATIVGRDDVTGLAVLDMPGEGLPHVPLAPTAAVGRGDPAVTVAAAAQDGPVATAGTVGASERLADRDQPLEGIVAVEGGAAPRALGGPVVDRTGALVGVTTATDDDGTAYLTPVDVATNVLDDVLTVGHARHSWMGIEGLDRNDPPTGGGLMGSEPGARGAEVTAVADTGPAATAGLRQGDVIVRAAGRPIESMPDLLLTLRARSPGDTVEVVVRRGTDLVTVTVTLGDPPGA